MWQLCFSCMLAISVQAHVQDRNSNADFQDKVALSCLEAWYNAIFFTPISTFLICLVPDQISLFLNAGLSSDTLVRKQFLLDSCFPRAVALWNKLPKGVINLFFFFFRSMLSILHVQPHSVSFYLWNLVFGEQWCKKNKEKKQTRQSHVCLNNCQWVPLPWTSLETQAHSRSQVEFRDMIHCSRCWKKCWSLVPHQKVTDSSCHVSP